MRLSDLLKESVIRDRFDRFVSCFREKTTAGGHLGVQVLFGRGELAPLQRLRYREGLHERVRDGIGPFCKERQKIRSPCSFDKRRFRRRS